LEKREAQVIGKDEWRWAAIRAVAIVVVSVLPYLAAYLATPADLVYTGFLLNAEDGYTYLAKVRQGWEGAWLHRLAFTPEPHQGEFVLTYYLFLGHVARWLSIPLVVMYHLARVVNGLLLLLTLYYAAAQFFEDVAQRRFAFLITALGSGLGWLLAAFEGTPVDLSVAEGFIFYSLFINGHFALAIACMILLLVWSVTPWNARRIDWRRLVALGLCTAVLSIVQPFCLVTVGLVLLLYATALWVRNHRLPWREIASGIVMGLVGLPFALNLYFVFERNPIFAAWSAQNKTPSPPPWDYALGYGIVLLLALLGLWRAIRRRRESDLLLVAWMLVTPVLLYVPFSLQRRLTMGWIVPWGGLAAIGWDALPLRRRPRPGVVYAAVSLTPVFLVCMSVWAALVRYELLFLTTGEWDALRWLSREAQQDVLVVASPEMGIHIPTWAGQRVYYGHPFETANADERRAQVEAFYRRGERDLSPPPDYVFYGPRERAMHEGNWQPDSDWSVAFRQGMVTIYAIPKE
jgi:hypothetical protein